MSTTLQSPVHAIAWDPHIAYEFTTVGGGGGSRVSFWMVEETKGGKEFNLKVYKLSCVIAQKKPCWEGIASSLGADDYQLFNAYTTCISEKDNIILASNFASLFLRCMNQLFQLTCCRHSQALV